YDERVNVTSEATPERYLHEIIRSVQRAIARDEMKFFEVEIPEEPFDGVEFIRNISIRKDSILSSGSQHATADRGPLALVRKTTDVSTAQFPRCALSPAAIIAAVVADDDFVAYAQSVQVPKQQWHVPSQQLGIVIRWQYDAQCDSVCRFRWTYVHPAVDR